MTKLEIVKAIHEHIKGELTVTNWRGTWDLFWRALDCGLDKARNLVDSYLNEDFERIAKRLKVSELEAILSALESKVEKVTVEEEEEVTVETTEEVEEVTVEQRTSGYVPQCDGCGATMYGAVYRTQDGCCDTCLERIFGKEVP